MAIPAGSLALIPGASAALWLAVLAGTGFLGLQVRRERRLRAGSEAREGALGDRVKALEAREEALEHGGLGVAHLHERRILWANPRWAELLGVRPEHLAGGPT